MYPQPARNNTGRFDGVIDMRGPDTYLECMDVTIAHPLRESIIRKASTQVLAAAKNALKLKKKHYERWSEEQKAIHSRRRLLPFVMETYGAFEPIARQFLRDVCDVMHIHSTSPQSAAFSFKQALRRCSIAVQKGNAQIIIKGCRNTRSTWF